MRPDRHHDIRAQINLLIESPGHSLRLSFASPAAARLWRKRAYKMRQLDRRASLRMFTGDDPRYGTCSFDRVEFVVEGADVVLSHITPTQPTGTAIELLAHLSEEPI